MVTIPEVLPNTIPTRLELIRSVMEALAEVRACSSEELEAEMNQAGGELEMESPEAVAVLSKVERRYGGRRLAKVEDLEPEELTSVTVLAGLIHIRWPAADDNRGNE